MWTGGDHPGDLALPRQFDGGRASRNLPGRRAREGDHRRFRANLYVDGLGPEQELEWLGRRIESGGAELEAVLRCERCVVITRDPETTATSPELLRLLTEAHETCMGVYCRVTRPGRLAVGDRVG